MRRTGEDIRGVDGPALVLDGGEHAFEGCRFSASNSWEVLVFRDAAVTLRGCFVEDCANRGLFVEGGRVVLEDCEIARNRLGIFVSRGAAVDLVRCRVLDHRSCGILYQRGSTGRIEDCVVRGAPDAALVVRDAAPTVTGGRFSGSTASLRVEAGGRPVVSGARLGPGYTGAWICAGADPRLDGCTIAGNETFGMYAEGGGTYTDCTWEDNGIGVLIPVGGDPRVVGSTIRGGPNPAVHALPGAKGRFEGCRISGDLYDGVLPTGADTTFA